MKKIYNNRTKRAYVFGSTMLLPGSNTAEEIDEKKFPQIAALIDDGDIVVEEDTAKAVKDANTQKAVDDILALSNGDEKTKEAASKRKKQLDKIDADAKAAAKKAEKADKDEEDDDDKDGDVE